MNALRVPASGSRKPPWLKRTIPHGAVYSKMRGLLKNHRLHTVCQEALCPNLGECFSRQTATFLILGHCCTRTCQFCAVKHGRPEPLDVEEPARVAKAAQDMGLRYVVITSVTRDDLEDGGAAVFAKTVSEVRDKIPDALVEVLIPDFQGNAGALETVLKATPHVLNHNMETVQRLYPMARPQAHYKRSLELLGRVQQFDRTVATKSGLMFGLGETSGEILETFRDLLAVGCQYLTLGQYLQPSKKHLPVVRFLHPEEFEKWRQMALDMGFTGVASGPFVRSSYQAKQLYERTRISVHP